MWVVFLLVGTYRAVQINKDTFHDMDIDLDLLLASIENDNENDASAKKVDDNDTSDEQVEGLYHRKEASTQTVSLYSMQDTPRVLNGNPIFDDRVGRVCFTKQCCFF